MQILSKEISYIEITNLCCFLQEKAYKILFKYGESRRTVCSGRAALSLSKYNLIRKIKAFLDFKQYLLGMLFYRYISENFVKFVNAEELEAGDKEFDYAKLDDEAAEEGRGGSSTVKRMFYFA